MKAKILTILVLLLSTACTDGGRKNESSRYVETARVMTVEVESPFEFPFIAKPLRTSVLSFRVSGLIDRFDVYAGNYYHSGELIAGIDPRDFQLRYEQAEAAYRQANADFERIASLYEKDNLPASSYEVARATWISARTARDAALNALNDTQLQAPFDGYIGEVFIERYQDVKASQPVVTLADISSLRIEVYVTQQIAMQIGNLNEVELEFDQLPGQKFRAKVIDCTRSTTQNNLSYLFTALLPNSNRTLPAGLSGQVRFNLSNSIDRVQIIPRKALYHTTAEGDCVWTVDTTSGRVTQRHIIVGKLLPEDRIVVNAGLQEGDMVVTSGLRFLNENQTVLFSNSNDTRMQQQ